VRYVGYTFDQNCIS